MKFPEGLEHLVTRDERLSEHTSFRLGGPADFFIRPQTTEDVQAIIQGCAEEGVPVYLLGRGTNVLIGDKGIRGAVVQLTDGVFDAIEGKGERITAGAAATLAQLVKRSADAGMKGLEVLGGIPGTVGGAVRMNAGSKYGCIADRISSVKCVNISGEVITRSRENLHFSNRESDVGRDIVIECEFELDSGEAGLLNQTVSEIIREKQASQPLSEWSAGCIFRNPAEGKAGMIIDECGLKGKSIGGAVVSDKHANFIVNAGDATSKDVLDLIDLVSDSVLDRYGVKLELEIEVWDK